MKKKTLGIITLNVANIYIVKSCKHKVVLSKNSVIFGQYFTLVLYTIKGYQMFITIYVNLFIAIISHHYFVSMICLYLYYNFMSSYIHNIRIYIYKNIYL